MSVRPEKVTIASCWRLVRALHDHDKRLVLRWVVAQWYNGFEPQKCQEGTKRLLREHLEHVLAWMAQSVETAGTPNLYMDEGAYLQAVAACGKLEPDEQRLLVGNMTDDWRFRLGGTPNDGALGLSICLQNLQKQSEANAAGWVAGVGYQTRQSQKRGRPHGKGRRSTA